MLALGHKYGYLHQLLSIYRRLHHIIGEDRCLIEQFFPGVCQGKYLDVGALDGKRWSTTYAFYKAFGWRGVNIEVDPDNYNELHHNRIDDIANVHAAVCSDSHKSVHYAPAKGDSAAGGIWEYSSAAHREQHWQDVTIYQTIPVQCTPLQSILDQTVGTKKIFFDFAVLDLEGAEFSALLGIDYNRMSFGVIIVERNDDANINKKITELLNAHGYILFNVERECSLRNLWFTHPNFHDIYSKLR